MWNCKVYNIAQCQGNLGRRGDGIKTLEDFAFKPFLDIEPSLVTMLVDLYHERGRLSEREEKIRDMPAKSEYHLGVQIALEYIELLRMAERKDLEILWQILLEKRRAWREWRQLKAFQLFICCLEKMRKNFLAEKLQALSEQIKRTDDWNDLYRAFRTLALIGTDEAYVKHYSGKGTAIIKR